MIASGTLCLICYLAAALAPYPLLNLIGCVVCGFSVGIMWPGTISISSSKIPLGGTALFALLAMAGRYGRFHWPICYWICHTKHRRRSEGRYAGRLHFPCCTDFVCFFCSDKGTQSKNKHRRDTVTCLRHRSRTVRLLFSCLCNISHNSRKQNRSVLPRDKKQEWTIQYEVDFVVRYFCCGF